MKKINLFFTLCLLGMISIAASAADIPNNEIWYEASSKLPETTSTSIYGLHVNTFNTTIKSHTFSDGKGIIAFNSDLTLIGNNAFYKCYDLTCVTIPNSVTSIGSSAFRQCSGLTSVTIPNSVTSIGSSAFSGCSGLTSVTIPNSVTSIGDNAFEGCVVSSFFNYSILNAEENNYWGARICDKNGLIIENNVVVGCAKWVTSITIPNSVTSIGSSAFYGCKGLTSVTIPNSVTSIGSSAFSGCSGLTSVTIPNSVTSIGADAFTACFGLTSVTIPNSVTSIGSSAFSRCSGLTSVTIPNSVTSIGEGAFKGCSGLTSVTIPNSVTSIGDYAFAGCSGLTSVTIPNSVTSIGEGAFSGCSGLTSLTIPNSVTSIGDYAFYKCIVSSFVNNSILNAKENNYWGAWICDKNGLVIENNVVVCCAQWVTSIIIPNTVTSIRDGAFEDRSGLASIEIPNSVTSIGYRAFDGCSGLKSIIVNWSRPLSITDNVFSGVDYDNCVLHVPKGTSMMYMVAPVWINFKNIQEIDAPDPTPTIRGDVNGDGVVDVADITEVAKIILTGKAKEEEDLEEEW